MKRFAVVTVAAGFSLLGFLMIRILVAGGSSTDAEVANILALPVAIIFGGFAILLAGSAEAGSEAEPVSTHGPRSTWAITRRYARRFVRSRWAQATLLAIVLLGVVVRYLHSIDDRDRHLAEVACTPDSSIDDQLEDLVPGHNGFISGIASVRLNDAVAAVSLNAVEARACLRERSWWVGRQDSVVRFTPVSFSELDQHDLVALRSGNSYIVMGAVSGLTYQAEITDRPMDSFGLTSAAVGDAFVVGLDTAEGLPAGAPISIRVHARNEVGEQASQELTFYEDDFQEAQSMQGDAHPSRAGSLIIRS